MPIVGNTSSQRKSIPDAPTSIGSSQPTAGVPSVDVSFSAPSFNGKLPVTSYTVLSSPGSFTASGATSPITVSGLTLGTNYTFTATAANAVGTSVSSSSGGSITPSDAFFHAQYSFSAQGTAATSSTMSLYGIGLDSSRNIYVNANQQASNANYCIMFKTNAAGIIEWQKYYGEYQGSSAYGIAVTSAGTSYLSTQVYEFPSSRPNVLVLDSSGTQLYQRKQTSSFGGGPIGFTPSGSVYTSGYSSAYSSGGYQSWNSDLSLSTGGKYGSNISNGFYDSSGNVYLNGSTSDNLSLGKIIKYNSSDTKVFDKNIAVDGQAVQTFKTVGAPSGNVYVLGYYYYGSPSAFFVLKFNSSGTFEWGRAFSRGYANSPSDICLDSSENVYVAGYGNISQFDSVYRGMIIKLNSSGTTQWQRLYDPGAYSYIKAIIVDSSNTMHIASTINSSNQNVVLTKLPSDGSKTGSYSGTNVSLQYTASSYSVSSFTPTITNVTTSINSAPTFSASSGGWGFGNSTVTRNQVTIP